MGSEVIVLISSDDEDDDWLVTKLPKRSKIQHADADVTVIEKMPCLEAKTPDKSSLGSSKVAQGKPPQDEDCCILSYDPETSVHVPDFQANEADDLVVVGERGPVACRDFPHARHLCIKFPYATTPHEKHCGQCHCYVCDVVAPCLHWGQGRHSSDHCHAFDKDDKWKKLRTQARSRASKHSARPTALSQRGHVIQSQLRTYTQPPLKVTLTTGLRGSTYSANSNASLPSFNQTTPNLNGLPAIWQPYLPSNQSTMLGNGSYVNKVATQQPNVRCVETANIGRVFNEHRSPVVNVAPSPASHQLGVHSPCPTYTQNTQNEIHMHGTMSHGSSIPASQPGMHVPRTPILHHQDRRNHPFSAVPYKYASRATEQISARPTAPPLTNFNKDLAILQSYLMEGISGEQQSQPTACESTIRDTGNVSQLACQMAQNVEVEPYDPFEPSEVLASANDGGPNVPTPQTTIAQANEQFNKDAGNTPSILPRNERNVEEPLSVGANSSLLDHILAEFDEEFWMLLEPTYPGF